MSGGPDSLALLLIAQDAMPGRIAAATVDHGLRPEAADEARFVAAICATRAIPHDILRPATPISGNLQSAARAARYALLGDWADRRGLPFIATAHHADDQLETLLMRLARGSGLSGLSGIRRRHGRLLRPLLDMRKAELVACCAGAGLEPVDDPSNRDDAFDRVRMRSFLAQTGSMLSAAAAVRSADALAEADAALRWAVAQAATDAMLTAPDGSITLHAAAFPREIQRRLLADALARLGEDPRGDTLSDALDRLRAGAPCSVGAHLCRPVGGGWHIAPAPPRRGR